MKTMFTPFSSMKTLEKNGYVQRTKITNKDQFSLTEEGRELADELFTNSQKGENKHESPSGPQICSMLVNSGDIECRTTLDVVDTLNRSNRSWKKSSIPNGSIWFLRNNEVYDTIVQFSGGNFSSTNFATIKHLSGTPFKRKIVIVVSKETSTCVGKKINSLFDYGVNLVYLDSPSLIANYLDRLCAILDHRGEIMGSLRDVISLCETNTFAPTVGETWQRTLKLFPCVGPQLAAAIYSVFKTPVQLVEYCNNAIRLKKEDHISPIDRFSDLIYQRSGIRPNFSAVDSLFKLIGTYDE